MTIHRAATVGDTTTTLLRAALQDTRLSFRARGVLASVLSRPRHWRTSADQLAQESPPGAREGRDAMRTALSELEACGYLRRRRVQVEGGRWSWQWDLTDSIQPVDNETVNTAANLQVRDITAGQTEDGSTDFGSTDVGSPVVLEVSREEGSRRERSTPPPLIYTSPPRARTDDQGGGERSNKPQPHPHEPNALAKLHRLTTERKLPIDPTDLLPWAYRLGHGNPWQGTQIIDQATTRELDNVINPRAAILARLTQATRREHAT